VRYNVACSYVLIMVDEALDLWSATSPPVGSASWIEHDPDRRTVQDHPASVSCSTV
jgi:hypothetical protein